MTEKKEEDKGVKVSLVPDEQVADNRLYSNFMEVTRSPYDFTLRFCNVPPIRDFEGFKKNDNDELMLHVPIVAQIAVPFDMVPGIMGALESQYNKYLQGIEGEKNENSKKTKPKKAGKK